MDTAYLNVFNFRTTAAPTANDTIAQSESMLYTDEALDFSAQVENPSCRRSCACAGRTASR